jgi:hypothetical protein
MRKIKADYWNPRETEAGIKSPGGGLTNPSSSVREKTVVFQR